MALADILKERQKKLTNIKAQGVDPYPSNAHRTHKVAEAKKALAKKVTVAGRLRSLRAHGKISFADLEDNSGKMQLFFSQQELPGEKYDFLGNLDLGDFIEACGEVFKTQAGEITVRVDSYQLLAKSIRPLPSSWYGLEDTEERYRQRYVDLIINPEVRQAMAMRHQVVRFLRQFMEEHDFTEVETPTLQPIYGGATAKPFVTHHNALDLDLYLRISDELYLKRLIVGGFEKIFEICKDFRNEGIDRQHNPEFTMMEFYWAYANYEDLMKLTEQMLSSLVKQIHGSFRFEYEGFRLDFKAPFKRATFTELVKEGSGIDLDQVETEAELKAAIKQKNIDLDLSGVVGYGPLCDELYKKVARPQIKQPTLVTDYPYQMKPLSKKASNPRKSASFQLVCMGYELINAYNELNDPAEQRARWQEQMNLGQAGLEEFQVIDEDYLKALEYGMPPTAGWGMGIDRLVSILADKHTIKDVILFPTLKPQSGQRSSQTKVMTVAKPSDLGINREQAYQMLLQMVSSKNLIKHGLSVEAVMRALAQKLGEDQQEWGVVGLLHDSDYELTDKDINKHTLVISEKLKQKGVSSRIINAIQAHSEVIKPQRENLLEKGIFAADELAGLITACALVQPDKKLASVNLESVLKKFKQKGFAKGAKREQILTCSELGLSLEEFVELALTAMQGISQELGL